MNFSVEDSLQHRQKHGTQMQHYLFYLEESANWDECSLVIYADSWVFGENWIASRVSIYFFLFIDFIIKYEITIRIEKMNTASIIEKAMSSSMQ